MWRKYQNSPNRNQSFMSGKQAEPKRYILLAVAIVIIVAGLLMLRSDEEAEITPLAFSCPTTTLAEKISQADLIITGEVFAVFSINEGVADVHIDPIKLYQGDIPARGVVIAAIPTVAVDQGLATEESGELHFASTQPPYLLYLTESSDPSYRTSRCNGSRLLGSGLTEEEKLLLGDGSIVP